MLALLASIVLLAGNIADADRTNYIAQLSRRIESVWRVPAGSNNLKIEILLVLDRSGKIIELETIAPSGNDEFDQSVLRAVRGASPFPPLPESISKSGAEFRLTLPRPPAPPPAEIKIPDAPRAPARPAKPAPKKIPGTAI